MEYKNKVDIIVDKSTTGTFRFNDINTIKKMLFSNANYGEKEFKKIKKCVCDGCNNLSIKNSHTIAKSTSLREIADLNHLYHPTFIKSYPVGNDIYKMEKLGIREASTFPGFCIEHEGMFSKFENNGIFDSADQVVKQIYRSICRNVAVCEKTIIKSEDILKRYFVTRYRDMYKEMRFLENSSHLQLGSWCFDRDDAISSKLKNKLDEQENLLEKVNDFKLNIWEIINGNVKDINIIAVNVDIVIPVAMCGFTECRTKNKSNLIFMNVIPTINNTLVAMAFKNNIIEEVERYIKNAFETPLGILNIIESMMINGTDDWYIKPNLWDSLDEARKRSILREMFVTRKSIVENTKYSIFDDIRRILIKKMESYGEEYRIIEIEKDKLFYSGEITDAQVKAKVQDMMN